MDRQSFFLQLDEILEVDSGTTTGATLLKQQDGWNSMAVISVIAMVDAEYSLALPPKGIAQCLTAEDLAQLVEHRQAEAPAR